MNKQYIAGFFDGEGSAMTVTIRREMKVGTIYRFRPSVRISQATREVLDEIAEYLGYGFVTTSPRGSKGKQGHRIMYDFVCNSNETALRFIDDIAPYAVLKKDVLYKLKELILFQNERCKSGYPYSLEDVKRMLDIRDEMFRLNNHTRRGLTQKYTREFIMNDMVFPDLKIWEKERDEKRYRKYDEMVIRERERRDRENPIIECACGCGKTFKKYDYQHRVRTYIQGHNQTGRHWIWKKHEDLS